MCRDSDILNYQINVATKNCGMSERNLLLCVNAWGMRNIFGWLKHYFWIFYYKEHYFYRELLSSSS